MKYQVIFRFWGGTITYERIVDNANIRNHLIKELKRDYAITYVAYNKILKDGRVIPVKSEILHAN